MPRVILLYSIFLYIADTSYAVDDDTRSQNCEVGDVVQNECLQCICTSEHIYKCAPRSCSMNSMENISLSNNKPACQPNMIYSTDRMTCICDKNGYWPHSKCNKVFQTLNTSNSCEANSYVIVDCNVCRCGLNGKIDKERCTHNTCEDIPNARRYMNNVYGSCEVKNWYSLAPCQFCFCVSQNKLVCNTGNYYAKKIDLGTYNLNVCGQGLIYEAIALIPDNDLSLRLGRFMNTTVTITPTILTSEDVLPDNRNKVIGVDKRNKRESKEQDNQQANDESYSDLSEEVTPKKVNEVASTLLPYSEDGEDLSKEYVLYSDKQEPDSGMEIGVEVNRQTPQNVMKTTKKSISSTTSEPKGAETLKNLSQNLGMTLKMSLPRMLDKMFKMVLRKSMLSLKGDTKCTPGMTKVVKCNKCFCMKNGKLLCTNNVCE